MRSGLNLCWDTLDFNECELTLKKMYCEVPNKPSSEQINEQYLTDCMKYSGRFNYNKAIDDCLEQLRFLKK